MYPKSSVLSFGSGLGGGGGGGYEGHKLLRLLKLGYFAPAIVAALYLHCNLGFLFSNMIITARLQSAENHNCTLCWKLYKL